jgi:hypothetical protein
VIGHHLIYPLIHLVIWTGFWAVVFTITGHVIQLVGAVARKTAARGGAKR